MSNYTDTFRKPAMTDETGIAIAEKLSGDTASEYKVNTSAEFRKAPMSDETAREILAKIDGGGSGASALSELSDVNLTNPSDGQVLHYDGTEWINATPVAELPAVTSDDNGDVLTVVEGAWAKAEVESDANSVVYTFEISGSSISATLADNKTIGDIMNDIENGKIVYLERNGNYYRLNAISGNYVAFTSIFPTNINDDFSSLNYSYYLFNKTNLTTNTCSIKTKTISVS